MLLKKKFFGKKEKVIKTLLTAGLLWRSPSPQPSCGVAPRSVLSTWRFAGFGSFRFTASLSSHFTEWKTEV